MTLVECMLALLILSLAVLAVTYTANAGHNHLDHGDKALRALRLAENLLEEVLSRPYHGSGATRATYCMDNFNGFSESSGALHSVYDDVLPDADQAFSRSVQIQPVILTVSDLDNAVIAGKRITVVVRDMAGDTWEVSRFVPEPME